MPLILTLEYALRWHEAPLTAVSHAFSQTVLTWENPSTLLPESTHTLPEQVERADWQQLHSKHAWFGLPTLPPVSVSELSRRDNIIHIVAPHAAPHEYNAVVWTLIQCARISRLDTRAWVRAVMTSYPNLATRDLPVEDSILHPWVNRYASPIFESEGSIALSCALAGCAVYGEYRLEQALTPDGTLIPIPSTVWDKVNANDFEPSGF